MLIQLACLLLLQTPQQSLPLPIMEPPNGYTIEGRLRFETDVKPVSIEVTLEVDDGQMVARTMSGPNGDFRFDRLRRGRYFITIEGGKFWNIREPVNVEQGTVDSIRVSYTLNVRPGMNDAPDGDTVSVTSLRLHPPSREAKDEYEKAIKERQKNQRQKAIEHLQKALKHSPDYYEAVLQLGIEQHRAGKKDEALQLLEKAVTLNPGSSVARHAVGKIYFEQQEFQKSADVLTELTKMGSTDAEVYTLLGVTFYKLNDFHRAEEHLSRALLLSPPAAAGPIRLQLFNVYMKTNRLPQALEQLETYLKDSPGDAAIQQQAARLRQILKK